MVTTSLHLSLLIIMTIATAPAHGQPLNAPLQAAHAAGRLPGLHGTISDLGDTRLAEVYFPGADERWGEALGERDHGPDTLHDLRSVTKSVVGLHYGIALQDGLVPAPDAPLYAQFPDQADPAADPDRQGILVGHALSMQMGLEWNEDLPYTDPRNSEIAMELAPDRYRFVLEQPVREAPGGAWIYSGGAVALIGKLIEDGSGMALDAFAADRLFTPLGIADFEWVTGADGVPSAASGLRLRLPDLVKIGHVVGRKGRYGDAQVIPAAWIDTMLQPRVTVDQNSSYGYLWYLIGSPDNMVAIAVGNGGQRLTVQPRHDLVTASFVGRYNDPEAWHTSLSVLLDFVVPEARKRLGK